MFESFERGGDFEFSSGELVEVVGAFGSDQSNVFPATIFLAGEAETARPVGVQARLSTVAGRQLALAKRSPSAASEFSWVRSRCSGVTET